MPDLIDKAQLHATAQVAKSYILEQDTANVSTIINALQSGGGSTGTIVVENKLDTGSNHLTVTDIEGGKRLTLGDIENGIPTAFLGYIDVTIG